MDVLIVAPTYDPHANAVRWAVEALGYESAIVDYGFSPTRSTMTYRTEDDDLVIKPFASSTDSLSETGCLWIRRASAAVFDDDTHPDDRRYSLASWNAFHRSFSVQALKHCDLVANDPVAYSRAVLKPIQLATAKAVGMSVPPTMASSDADDIVAFIARNDAQGARTIVKPFVHMKWATREGRIVNANTSIVTAEMITTSDIRSCPMIYQREVLKNYEVRVLICGMSHLAVRIDKQAGRGALDWRLQSDPTLLRCERIEVPGDVIARMTAFMQELGVVTASLDFIVDEAGEWVFLESNEGGNFLWLETVNQDLPVLDLFAKFLISRDGSFSYVEKRDVTIEQFDRAVGVSYLSGKDVSHPNGGTRAVIEA